MKTEHVHTEKKGLGVCWGGGRGWSTKLAILMAQWHSLVLKFQVVGSTDSTQSQCCTPAAGFLILCEDL